MNSCRRSSTSSSATSRGSSSSSRRAVRWRSSWRPTTSPPPVSPWRVEGIDGMTQAGRPGRARSGAVRASRGTPPARGSTVCRTAGLRGTVRRDLLDRRRADDRPPPAGSCRLDHGVRSAQPTAGRSTAPSCRFARARSCLQSVSDLSGAFRHAVPPDAVGDLVYEGVEAFSGRTVSRPASYGIARGVRAGAVDVVVEVNEIANDRTLKVPGARPRRRSRARAWWAPGSPTRARAACEARRRTRTGHATIENLPRAPCSWKCGRLRPRPPRG